MVLGVKTAVRVVARVPRVPLNVLRWVVPRRRAKGAPDVGLLPTMKWLLLFVGSSVPGIGRVFKANSIESLPPALASYAGRPLNILCMDGGGIRGRNLLVAVEEIEGKMGKPIGQLFDLVGGTSIGGCGALFVNKYGNSMGEAARMARTALMELQTRCFADQSGSRLLRFGHLCRDHRREMLLELCGSSQPLTPPGAGSGGSGVRAFAVASRCRLRGSLEPFLFRTYRFKPPSRRRRRGDNGQGRGEVLPGTCVAQLWQAVEATSAAPAIFPRARLRGMLLADGGLVANDPTLLTLKEACALWPGRRVGLVLSLGTGAANPGLFPGDDRVREAVQAMGGVYVRYQPPVRGISFIETDESKLTEMEEATRRHFRYFACRDVCRRLSASRGPSLRGSWDKMADSVHETCEQWRDACAAAWNSWWSSWSNKSSAGVIHEFEADLETAAWGSAGE